MKKPIRRIFALPAEPRRRLATMGDVHRLLAPLFSGADREHLWRVDLNSRGGFLGAQLVSIGTVDQSPCDPREIFGPALSARASRVVIAHNHPSGSLEPSAQDLASTRRLELCGLLLGVELADHLILNDTEFCSLRTWSRLKSRPRGRRMPAWLIRALAKSRSGHSKHAGDN